jgi:HK97 family phage major capsid protein/HK97 family phage prohead protease
MRAFTSGIRKRDDGAVEMSFSSEAEIEVYPGEFEVLSHAPGACDLSRLQASGLLLFNHNRDFPLGRLDGVRIDTDKMGRCVVPSDARSQSTQAQEIWKDIDAGVLTSTSVCYKVQAYTQEKREDGSILYTVTKWQPSEVTVATIPADISTGVSRADNTENTNMPNRNRYQRRFLEPDTGLNPPMPAAAPAPATAPGTVVIEQERSAGATGERQRIISISDACRTYGAPDELRQRAINEGMSMDQLRTHLLEHVRASNQTLAQAGRPVGMNQNEVSRFRFMNLFRAMAEPTNPRAQENARLEIEACRAAADQITYRSVKGVVIPSDVLFTPFSAEESRQIGLAGLRQRDAAISVQGGDGYTGTGANVVATTLMASAFIEILRHKCILMQLGTQLGGLVGNFEIPKMTSSQFGGGWVGEDAVAPNTQVDFAQIPLTVKTVAAYAYITRKMLTQPSIGVEALVRMDIAKKLGQKIDLAGYYGTGADDKQPLGLKLTNGINAVPFAGANPTYAELVEMETRIALDDADVDTMAYVANARFRGYAKTALKFPNAVNGAIPQGGTIWEPGNSVNGYSAKITNQAVTGDVFFGNWSDMLIGLWGGLEILADPFTKSTQGGIVVSAFQDADIAIRRVQSFCYGSQTAADNQA